MNLPDEKREAVCLALAEQHGCVVEAEDTGRLLTCRGCAEQADALAPLLAGWLAKAWDEGNHEGWRLFERRAPNPYRADAAETTGGGE